MRPIEHQPRHITSMSHWVLMGWKFPNPQEGLPIMGLIGSLSGDRSQRTPLTLETAEARQGRRHAE
jgi:hypothetical protein